MDGVLVDSEPLICEAAILLFREKGVWVKPGDFLPFVGTGENLYIGGVAAKYGLDMDIPAAKKRLYEIYAKLAKGKLQPLPGVPEFIHECRQRGLKLAVATSADEVKMRVNLAEIGLSAGNFHALVRGEDVKHKKPAPDIYLLAAERIHLPPEECLVIEDAPSGIKAGKSAGAKVMALTTSFPESELHEADIIVPDLASVDNTIWS